MSDSPQLPIKERQLIPFAGVNIGQIDRTVDRALQRMRQHYSTEPTEEAFDRFVMDLYSCFPQIIRYDVFYSSVMTSAGKLMTREVIQQLAWRLAGNIKKLKAGIPVPPWTNQKELEWCPITIVKADLGYGYENTFGCFYEYRVLAGSPSGLKFTTFWSKKYARFISSDLGFRKTRIGNFSCSDGRELTRMQLYLLLDPELSKEGRPIAYHYHVPASMQKHNLEIIKQRFRVTPCPLGYSLFQLPCISCPIGYEECKAGCHPKNYQSQFCPRCQDDKWFDPLHSSGICIDCIELNLRGIKKE